jgi:hypothetical protein
MLTKTNLKPLVALIVLPGYLAACTTWQVQNRALAPVTWERPEKIRITLGNGAEFEVRQPWIVGDSLVGDTLVRKRRGIAWQPVSLPVEDVVWVAQRGIHGGKTVGLTLVLVAVAGAVVAAAAMGGELY